MNLLWTCEALVAAMDGRPVGGLPEGVTGISIDSRTLQAGEAFFAIRGEKFDGHDFATAAMAAGASILVVAEEKLPSLGRLAMPKIVVQDVLVGLENVAAAARARSRARVIAVTGSVGKTTSKEMLRHALGDSGSVHASEKSFNNHWGVPLTLARLPADCDYAIFEIGMNHPGEIRPLVRLVRPHIAIVTLIAAAHLGHFKNLDEIATAKAEIFEGLEPNGHALINRDDPKWRVLERQAKAAGAAHVWGFGEHARAQMKLLEHVGRADGSTITAMIGRHKVSAEIGIPGRHIVQNALAVLGAAHLAGADPAKAALAMGNLVAERGRGRRYSLAHADGTFTLIDESYNANPASMAAALDLLAEAPVGAGGRRIAVLGDMLELGEHSARLHAALAEEIGSAKTDKVFLAGSEMKVLAEQLPAKLQAEYRPTVEDLQGLVVQTVRAGDAVMIKSSNGIGFSRIVDALLEKYPVAAEDTQAA